MPEDLEAAYKETWEFIAGLRCHATRRVQLVTPQTDRPGIYNSVVADDWGALRAQLVEQAEREAAMGR